MAAAEARVPPMLTPDIVAQMEDRTQQFFLFGISHIKTGLKVMNRIGPFFLCVTSKANDPPTPPILCICG